MTLEIYPVVLELVRKLAPLLPTLRARSSALADQFERALISVPLNVAEGAGRVTPRERARHYAIARGSAVECLACLDLLELEANPPRTDEGRTTLLRLLDVLTALIRR